ncbi:hypothetical protein DDE74_26875 [Streptomyces lydicus]|uniref:Uncharacterized protein n=1 Tax=Streptomyces lydicus TaxID=47763 RepID=A0A3Q9K961_9ACTN|nr:hypothetical protein DDE74_26875 [Streptomyces lydicus]
MCLPRSSAISGYRCSADGAAAGGGAAGGGAAGGGAAGGGAAGGETVVCRSCHWTSVQVRQFWDPARRDT